MRAFALNCTLKESPEASSTDTLLDEVGRRFSIHGVAMDRVRLADRTIKFGVAADEGSEDWPAIREQILGAQILIIGTPIWLGHPSSRAQQALERLDAFLGERDDRGQIATADRVAVAAIVGNEDGAHHVSAELFQGLNDVGFTIPANGVTYWVGEAMHDVDLKDLPAIPKETADATRMMVDNAVHLAAVLEAKPYRSLEIS